jgi:hypothetical protein
MTERDLRLKYFVIKMNQAINTKVLLSNLEKFDNQTIITGYDLSDAILKAMVL